MKFKVLLTLIDSNTKIRLIVTVYGMKFEAEHFQEYFTEKIESKELLDEVVKNMRVSDNCLEVIL